MSKLAPGTYIIVNRVLSPEDEMLAITFNGQGKTATVTPTTAASGAQRWVIKDYDAKTQYVTPADAPGLQAAWGSGVVTVLPAGGYVWTIRKTDEGYTIQDGGVTQFWGLDVAHPKSPVTIGAGTATLNEKQRWLFDKA
ncbi:hypothetical protein K443DRAFT_124679 [Laccaria amethystina LaAM-08-1]|uniref:CCL2-like lectin domain-containing protein n=1 Tax=Laccaria amethystina LaAM-08-1 TaxID=1095629 RepID=A0A0C9XI86_9AGAR|nr:hypothetical protein K443DRAFT_124679 [Laccaria amethystina LaAM-08-1]